MTAPAARVPTVALLGDAETGALAATSTREGGVSEGPFASLNLGFRATDSPDRVRENRRRFAGSLGLEPDAFVCARQVHGRGVAVVGRSDLGRGALAWDGAIPDCDALVTAEAGVPLLILSADCPVVVVADRRTRALGAAHAGWRGLLGGVLESTVDALVTRCGSRPADLFAAVSPCIGVCCYEVGDDVVAAGRRAMSGFDAHLAPGSGERPHLDLKAAARAILERARLDPASVRLAPECTRCRGDMLFSYRGSGGQCGLLGTAAVLRPR